MSLASAQCQHVKWGTKLTHVTHQLQPPMSRSRLLHPWQCRCQRQVQCRPLAAPPAPRPAPPLRWRHVPYGAPPAAAARPPAPRRRPTCVTPAAPTVRATGGGTGSRLEGMAVKRGAWRRQYGHCRRVQGLSNGPQRQPTLQIMRRCCAENKLVKRICSVPVEDVKAWSTVNTAPPCNPPAVPAPCCTASWAGRCGHVGCAFQPHPTAPTA